VGFPGASPLFRARKKELEARMIAELGHYALMLALGLALIQATMPIIGTRTNDPVLMSMAAPTALAHFAFVAMAFTALATCYVISDFSVDRVEPIAATIVELPAGHLEGAVVRRPPGPAAANPVAATPMPAGTPKPMPA
jgi:hypothetical protein